MQLYTALHLSEISSLSYTFSFSSTASIISVRRGTKAREFVIPIINMEIRGRYQLSKGTPLRRIEGPRIKRAIDTMIREIKVR